MIYPEMMNKGLNTLLSQNEKLNPSQPYNYYPEIYTNVILSKLLAVIKSILSSISLLGLKAFSFSYLFSKLKKMSLTSKISFNKSIISLISKVSKLSLIFILSYLIYKQLPFNNSTKLIYKQTPFNDYIKNKLGKIKYTPTFFIPGCMLQMLYHQFRPKPDLKFKREYIKVKDGGVFSMDWVVNINNKRNLVNKNKINSEKNKFPLKPPKLLVILHGLLGGSEAGYVREIIQGFQKTNEYKIVVIHNRGISDTPLFTPFTFHASYTSDLKSALNLIKRRFPNFFCCCLGTSLGANIFVKLLAQDHSLNDYVKCLISISNPLNLIEGEKKNRGGLLCCFMRNNFLRYYNKHPILKSVKGIDFGKSKLIKFYREVDLEFTIKVHNNFKSVEDYYMKSSSYYDIHKLDVPTLFINSKDDLMSHVDSVDFEKCKCRSVIFSYSTFFPFFIFLY
jgi:predicted alpha/beta-fold hydrolase